MPKRHEYFPILRKELIIDKLEEEKKKELEKQIFFLMAGIYCQDVHSFAETKVSALDIGYDEKTNSWLLQNRHFAKYQFCPECIELVKTVFIHTQRCPHSVYKTFYHECPTMCYPKEIKEKISLIMRHSRKKLIKKHPVYSFRFLVKLINNKNKIKKFQKEV